MLSRLKFEIDEVIIPMLSKIPDNVWESKTTTFGDLQMAGGQFIKQVVEKLRTFGHSDKNIKKRVFGYSENSMYLSYINGLDLIGTFDIYSKENTENMKFDVIIGNPPYQELKTGNKKSKAMWPDFVIKSFELCKDGGYVSLIHPSGWRNVDGKFKNIQSLLLANELQYLEIHNESDGLRTFGAETRYDWYVIKNTINNKNKTVIKFQDGITKKVGLTKSQFIPNGDYGKINSLIATENEETVNVLYNRSVYGTDKKNTNKEKTNIFKHPLIYTVDWKDNPTFFYSSSRGIYFDIPKLIWSNGRISSIGSLIDNTGKYGLTQFAYAIVDTPENLPLIKKAFDTTEFRKLMESCAVGQLTLNYKVLATFRKDFWKEFI